MELDSRLLMVWASACKDKQGTDQLWRALNDLQLLTVKNGDLENQIRELEYKLGRAREDVRRLRMELYNKD